jgi:cysteinyl-tRNA synthetase
MPAPLTLYDNYTRTLRRFEALDSAGPVGLYTCGPTVYDYQHIGNFRTFLFEDLLKRILRWNGYNVRHVMNITDVGHLTSDADTGEDKMEKGARRTGKSAWEIAQLYTDDFRENLARLHIEDASVLCRATDHIREQIEFIADLERGGYTYTTADGVYFDTSKQPILLLDDAKMAKSAGEFLRVQSLLDRGYDPLVYRYLCLTAHYRTQMNFSWEAMDAAATALDRMRNGFYALAATADTLCDANDVERFGDNLNDDLNLPRALAVAWEVLRGDRPSPVKRATLAKFDQVLGLGLAEWMPRQDVAPAEIQALADARAAARVAKQWAQADELRAQIASAGWEMEDQPAGYRLRRR